MSNSKNVLVGKPKATGGVRYGRGVTDFPSDASTPLSVALKDAGYVSEDGLVETIDASDDKIKAWGGDIVKIVRTEHSVSYTFTLIESANADALKLMFGEKNVKIVNATSDHGKQITVDKTATMVPRATFVFDMLDGDAFVRVLVKDGQPAISGDISFTDGDVIGYEVTVEAFPDENGVKSILMVDDGQKTGNLSE